MTDTNTADREALGFFLEERGDVWVVQFKEGGCRPATIPEKALWGAFQAGRASIAASAGSEPDNAFPLASKIYKRGEEWVLEVSGTINDCHFTCRHTQPGNMQPEDVAGLPTLYTHPSPPEGMVGGWRKGVEDVAALLAKKADDFATEHGYDDMGGLSFGRGAHADAKLDYHSNLIELAEEVHAMLATTPTPGDAA